MTDIQQSLRQASVRLVTSTSHTYEGDWHALWDSLSIPAGDYNGRMLQYINTKLGTSYTNINSAMAALAVESGATTFQAIGTFTASTLTAPVATWVSDAATAQAVFQLIVDDDVVSGDKIWGESSTDNFSTVLETVSAAISAGDLSDLQIDDFAFAPFTPDGTYYARFWISNSADVQISAKSNTVSLAISTTPSYAGTYYYLGF